MTDQSLTVRLGYLRMCSEQEPPAVGQFAVIETLAFRAERLAVKSKCTIHLPAILAE